MKTKLFLIMAAATLLSSCADRVQTLYDNDYAFFIFRYKDDASKELIITQEVESSNDTIDARCRSINGIFNYPKRYRNEPYFGSNRWGQNPEKYTFDICELATNEKVLALHGNFYTYFPYTNINCKGSKDVIRKGNWSSICEKNPMKMEIVGSADAIYSEIRFCEIQALEKITNKSRKEMTIDDIAQAVNKIIDEGNLDKYTTVYTSIHGSNE